MGKLKRADAPYVQIAGHIRSQVLGGELKPGDKVQSVEALAKTWGVAKMTADKALSVLRSEGLLRAEVGRGTFVAKSLPLDNPGVGATLKALRDGKALRDDESVTILSCGMVPAPAYVAEQLGVEEGEDVVRRHRAVSCEGVVTSINTVWHRAEAAEHAPELLEPVRITLRGGNLGALADRAGWQPTFRRTHMDARLATEQEGRELGVELPAAVMTVSTLLTGADGFSIEYCEKIMGPNSGGYNMGSSLD